MATKTPKPSDTDYEELGKAITRVMSNDLVELIQSRRKVFAVGIVRGAGVAVGGVIGLSMLAVIIGFLLNYLHGLPILGHLLETIGHGLQH